MCYLGFDPPPVPPVSKRTDLWFRNSQFAVVKEYSQDTIISWKNIEEVFEICFSFHRCFLDFPFATSPKIEKIQISTFSNFGTKQNFSKKNRTRLRVPRKIKTVRIPEFTHLKLELLPQTTWLNILKKSRETIRPAITRIFSALQLC